MASKNKVNLIGYFGKDPESRSVPSGDAFTTFTIATSDRWRDKDGNQKEHTEWHNCVANAQIAKYVAQYGKKGRLCELEGKLRTRKYTDGQGVDRYTTEIRVSEFQFLDKAESNEQQPAPQNQQQRSQGNGQQRQQPAGNQRQQPASQQQRSQPAMAANGTSDNWEDDDIPFE